MNIPQFVKVDFSMKSVYKVNIHKYTMKFPLLYMKKLLNL
jgi:hypothetical protein